MGGTGYRGGALVRLEQDGPAGARLLDAVVLDNRRQVDRYWALRLHAPAVAESARPGQFAMLTVARDGESHPVLPRPMALYDWDRADGWVDVVYGVVGAGTRLLSTFRPGERLTLVGPLGRGFVRPAGVRSVLAVGRGIGVCSLARYALDATAAGALVCAVLSGRTPEAVIGEQLLTRAGVVVHPVNDADGSSDPADLRSLLRARLDDQPPQQIVTCGSDRLLELCAELGAQWGCEVQVAVEAHMACGLGYCHGCASGMRDATAETPLVCRDGPAFRWVPDSA